MGPLARDEFAALVSGGEDSFTEFKAPHVANQDVAKEMCAFSNASGGRILIGVDDDGTIVGDSEWDEERVMNLARTSIDPAIIPTYQRLVWEPGVEIAVVGVDQGAEKPYAVRSGERRVYYMRVGSTCREATREELIRLTQASGAVASDLRPVLGASVDDLDAGLLEERFSALRHVRWNELTAEERARVLANAEILHPEVRRPTIFGLLVYGREPQRHLSHAYLSCVSYPGTDVGAELADQLESRGRLNEQIEAAASFIERNVSRPSSIEGLRRVERLRPSSRSYREVLANAVAHRHYGIAGPSTVRVFADRVEVMSPGGLPNGVTVEGMRLGVTVRRNDAIFQHLGSLGYADAVGRGVVLLVEEALERGLREPRIEAAETWTKISLSLGEEPAGVSATAIRQSR
jgi:ATP-dependent DNA helicase RecG